jgi:hypothetical protein
MDEAKKEETKAPESQETNETPQEGNQSAENK